MLKPWTKYCVKLPQKTNRVGVKTTELKLQYKTLKFENPEIRKLLNSKNRFLTSKLFSTPKFLNLI